MKMKKIVKRVLIILLAAVLVIAAVGLTIWQYCYDGLKTGMTLEEFGEKEEAWSENWLLPYCFREKENGDGLVVHFRFIGKWGKYEVDEMRFYPDFATGDPDENFDKVEVGMSVYEVVELMGFPDEMGNGIHAMVYEGKDGAWYRITLAWEKKDNGDMEYTVARVSKSE